MVISELKDILRYENSFDSPFMTIKISIVNDPRTFIERGIFFVKVPIPKREGTTLLRASIVHCTPFLFQIKIDTGELSVLQFDFADRIPLRRVNQEFFP